MTAPIDAALTRYTEQLLAGTGLNRAAAEALATDLDTPTPPEGDAAAAALRDGWATATHACHAATAAEQAEP